MDLSDCFKEAASKYPNQTAIQYKVDTRWATLTYNELKNKIESLSAFLSEQGIKKYDRIAILLENRPQWPMIFLSTVSIGAISIPINPEASQKEIENILTDSGCKIAFVNNSSFLLTQSKIKAISVDSDEFRKIIG